ncbi:MAG: DegT/DnrJ/EryC1/StrS aminotransferase family protein [Magnetococcus sp. YQC-5]
MNLLPTPPEPRFRLYTSLRDYLTIFGNLLFGRVTQGDDLKDLEQSIAHMIGVDDKTTLLTPQARVAVYLAVKSLIQSGRRNVILSPYTIPDVINMVLCAGGIPCFVDIDRTTCNINPKTASDLIDHTTGAVMVTHLFGLATDLDLLKPRCIELNVPLIEDASHAFGTIVNGWHVGTMGDAGIFSFGMYNPLNCLYGGMLVTPHAQVLAHAATLLEFFPWMDMPSYLQRTFQALVFDLITHPWIFKSITFWIRRYGLLHHAPWSGISSQDDCDSTLQTTFPEHLARRMTPMQARILMRQLDSVAANTRARIDRAKLYHHGLQDLPDLILPPLRLDSSHGYTQFPIQSPQRNALMHHLLREGRDVAPPHLTNCAQHPCFIQYARDCPNAQATANQILLLPTYPRYSIQEVQRNIQSIRRFFKADG